MRLPTIISLLFFPLAQTLCQCSASTIQLRVMYLEGGQATSLAGALVQCWDEDFPASDDRMTGVQTTDSSGSVTLHYTRKKKSTIFKPTRGWDRWGTNTNPDIYCRIEKPGVIYPLTTRTKKNHKQTRIANFGTVYAYPDRVGRGD